MSGVVSDALVHQICVGKSIPRRGQTSSLMSDLEKQKSNVFKPPLHSTPTPGYEFSFRRLFFCITMEKREKGVGGDQRALAQASCTSELTFLCFFLSSSFCLLCPPPQTTKAFLPKMLELNHGHIVTVASSLGLFSTAGVEVSIIHSNSYPSHRSHHLKTSASSRPGAS